MIKSLVEKLIPSALLERRRRRKMSAENQRNTPDKSVAETFGEIDESKARGGRQSESYSGGGSTAEYAERYARTIRQFIADHKIKRVVDLGGSDFRVASKFVSDAFHYTGCAAVFSLVKHLNETHKRETIEFRCVSIVEDELPDGDLCLSRQVLQHLSNHEIAQVLQNAQKFKYLIVTEHHPNPSKEFTPNLDVPHESSVRVRFDSAVVLDEPPFNLKNVKLLLDVEAEEGTRIKTFVIEQ